MPDKSIKILLYLVLACIIGLAYYTIFGPKDKAFSEAIDKLNQARSSIDSVQNNLTKVIQNSDEALNRNQNFKQYLLVVDSLINKMDKEGKKREKLYLNNIAALDKSIEGLKKDLLKMSSKLPELETDVLTKNPN